MNKLYLLLVFLLPTFIDIQGQVVAVKTNVLYDAITTPNIGAEVAFNKHWSVEASGYYNGWTFSSDKSFKHWMIQARGALLDTRAFQRTFLRGSCPVYRLRFRRFEAPVWDGEKE